jgi:hypothetical protein
MIMQGKVTFLVCPTCKKDIKGTAYACPECATMYCISCAIKRAERNEPCLKCKKPLRFC